MSENQVGMQTRRKFVECSACALLLLGCGEKAQSDTSGAGSSSEDTAIDDKFDPCTVTAESGWLEVSLDSYPALSTVGGYVTMSVGGNSMVIAHVEEGCYAAVSSSCTHQGGNIYYSEQRQQFSCQLHAATFNLDGEWALGQIAANLQSFLVARDGNRLLVQV